jgi:hypothetical protein
MGVAQTSIAAYKKLGDLGVKQLKVYNALRTLGRATNEELQFYLDWPINQITGRTHELVEMGFAECCGHTTSRSGNRVKLWAWVDKFGEEQVKRAINRDH